MLMCDVTNTPLHECNFVYSESFANLHTVTFPSRSMGKRYCRVRIFNISDVVMSLVTSHNTDYALNRAIKREVGK